MVFPEALRLLTEAEAERLGVKKATALAAELSARYRSESGRGKRLVTTPEEAAVYSAVRMPATYGAVSAALSSALASSNALDISDNAPVSLIDAGAGTGAAAWAAGELLPIEKMLCLERENAMLALGRKFAADAPNPVRNAEWRRFDLMSDALGERADLVIASYTLGELGETERAGALRKLWNATEKLLLIVEPGTPEGYRQIIAARQKLLSLGAHIAAPCPHENDCPITEGDWCHFTCRVARSKLHKLLKGGDAPYEDEKFAYLAVTREPADIHGARILRHPIIEKGRVGLTLCAASGISELAVTKKDAELYKIARKASAGDIIDINK